MRFPPRFFRCEYVDKPLLPGSKYVELGVGPFSVVLVKYLR